ncbi:alpha/beta hydrolase [Bacillus sp. JCM 19041]
MPILLIHGEQDTFVPFKMVYQLHQAGKDLNEMLIILEFM